VSLAYDAVNTRKYCCNYLSRAAWHKTPHTFVTQSFFLRFSKISKNGSKL